jgi:aminoglycoside phosphotransferase (APT) family kinase protein
MNVVAPNVREFAPVAEKIAAWLRARLPDAENLRVDNFNYPSGAGLSHETLLFDALWRADGRDVHQGLVVRIKPTEHTVFPDTFFEQQYEVMRLLHQDGRVKVAKPFWFEEDASILGAPFFAMERRRGRVPVSMPPYRDTGWVAEATPAQRAKMWENGVRQLAAVQAPALAQFDFLQGPAHARSGLAQEWDKYERFVAWIHEDGPRPVLDAGLKRLAAIWPKHQPPGLVWGDARIGNVMFDENFEVSAVMDWEQPSLGGALQDLSWWLVLSQNMHGKTADKPHLAGMGTREETITLWREITGLSTDDLEWYEDFTQLKLACLSVRTSRLRGWPEPTDEAMAKRLKVA